MLSNKLEAASAPTPAPARNEEEEKSCVFVIELKAPTVINVFRLSSGCLCATAPQVAQTHSQHTRTHVNGGTAAWLMEGEARAGISDGHSITRRALRRGGPQTGRRDTLPGFAANAQQKESFGKKLAVCVKSVLGGYK